MQGDQKQHGHGQSDTTNAITLTLTVIVIMYAVLVSPAEISNIFTHMIDSYLAQHRTTTAGTDDDADSTVQSGDDEDKSQASAHGDAYNVAVAVANALQTLNFACNFVLYCAVNVHFRRIVRQMVTCRPWWRWTVARPSATTTAAPATTYIARTHLRDDHVPMSKSTRLQSTDGHHFDIEEYDLQ